MRGRPPLSAFDNYWMRRAKSAEDLLAFYMKQLEQLRALLAERGIAPDAAAAQTDAETPVQHGEAHAK